ncbi:MAG: hypothetical protein IPO31_05890 [Candidatus Obscuribacter sp.]|nr:hypothetical protein [Candidatus Obscuribacter sp.]
MDWLFKTGDIIEQQLLTELINRELIMAEAKSWVITALLTTAISKSERHRDLKGTGIS